MKILQQHIKEIQSFLQVKINELGEVEKKSKAD